ncbi:MAG: dihydroorotate dehydrogenase [Solirubrobacterales bacterium]|nr:dihydroorotate dehydrogenase [Solirubrobacterales bacterium]
MWLRLLLRLRGAAARGRLPEALRGRPGGRGGPDRDRAGRRLGALTVDLGLDLCGLRLEHPILNGSGTFDAIAARRAFGDELDARLPFSLYVSKTITPEPRAGNPAPRLYETPAGMVNSIGLPNKGLAGFLDDDLPRLAALPVPLCVSVMAPSRDGFGVLVERVAGRVEVAALELNVSCPNVHSGLIVGERPAETLALLGSLRPLTDKPLIVKLTPNCADPAAVARAAEEGGADAVSLINTLRATALEPRTLAPWLGAGSGGLSGPAIRSLALDQVRRVAAEVSIPVVGMGGIESGADALAMLSVGASAVAVGTASFRDPLAAERVRSELAAALDLRGLSGLPVAGLVSTSS